MLLHLLDHLRYASLTPPPPQFNATQVEVQAKTFLKDVVFYLMAVGLVFGCLLDGQIITWECVLLGLLYVMYVAMTFYLAQGDEPVHADQVGGA